MDRAKATRKPRRGAARPIGWTFGYSLRKCNDECNRVRHFKFERKGRQRRALITPLDARTLHALAPFQQSHQGTRIALALPILLTARAR
eukprot:4572878-Pleurochrysis_carterae.AAC.3